MYEKMTLRDILKSTNGNKPIPLYTILKLSGKTTYNKKEFKDVTVVIGDQKFDSLEEALEAAVNGDTLKINEDLNPTASYEIAGKTVTIDLNGKTIKGNWTFPIFKITATNSNLTIKDTSDDKSGVIMHGKAEYGGAISANGSFNGSVTIEGGTIKENEGTKGGGAIGLFIHGYSNNFSVNITGGIIKDNFTSAEASVAESGGGAIYLRNANSDSQTAKISITGGTFLNNTTSTVAKVIYSSNTPIVMDGGEIYNTSILERNANDDAHLIVLKAAAKSVTLTSGTIGHENKMSVEECIDATNLTIGEGFVFKGLQCVATVGNKKFANITTALNESTMDTPAKLAQQLDLEETLIIPKNNCHLDLNGFDVVGKDQFTLIFSFAKNFKISNSAEDTPASLKKGAPSIKFDQSSDDLSSPITNTVCGGAIYACTSSSIGGPTEIKCTLENIKIEENVYEGEIENVCGTAIYLRNCDMDLTNVEIINNKDNSTSSVKDFGAVCLCDTSIFTLNSGKIANNECKTFANHVYIGSPNSQFVMYDGDIDNTVKTNELPIIFSHDTSNVDFNTIDIKGGNLADDKESVYQCFDFTNKEV